jgi:hypothetical protein
MSNDLVVVGPPTSPYEALLRDAEALRKNDEAGLRTILKRAAELEPELDGLQLDTLFNTLRDATGHGKKTIKAVWEAFKKQADKERAAKAEEERLRRAADYAAKAKGARDAERARLLASCSVIAESALLLEAVTETAHLIGVVNEDANIKALYLTCSSRLLAEDAIRILRTGASASGKN